jgi:hypothetical protein
MPPLLKTLASGACVSILKLITSAQKTAMVAVTSILVDKPLVDAPGVGPVVLGGKLRLFQASPMP